MLLCGHVDTSVWICAYGCVLVSVYVRMCRPGMGVREDVCVCVSVRVYMYVVVLLGLGRGRENERNKERGKERKGGRDCWIMGEMKKYCRETVMEDRGRD